MKEDPCKHNYRTAAPSKDFFYPHLVKRPNLDAKETDFFKLERLLWFGWFYMLLF